MGRFQNGFAIHQKKKFLLRFNFSYDKLWCLTNCRLWEDGWKERYYQSKFDVGPEDDDFRYTVVGESSFPLFGNSSLYSVVLNATGLLCYHFRPMNMSWVFAGYCSTTIRSVSVHTCILSVIL